MGALLPPQTSLRNRLLLALPPADFAVLQPHLVPRAVTTAQVLYEAEAPLEEVYFPETGLISFVTATSVETEVGIVGHDGVVGANIILKATRWPLKTIGQMPGEGFVVGRTAMLDALATSHALDDLLARYVQTTMMQAASTVYANAHFTVEQRLARWLLMVHDRVIGDEITITHEFLATMLCVRRPGVTVATHVLEGEGMIRARRGRITVVDRDKLKSLAGDSYGLAESEYARLLAPLDADAGLLEAV